MFDPFNPFSQQQMGVLRNDPRGNTQANAPYGRDPRAGAPPYSGMLNPFSDAQSTFGSSSFPVGPTADAFTSDNPLRVDVRRGPPSGPQVHPGAQGGGQRKPSGPIMTPSPNAPSSNSTQAQGQPDQQMTYANGDNPWINPADLARMDGSAGNAPKAPGEGLWALLNSGAAQGMKDASNGGYGPPIPKELQPASQGWGDKGSPMSALTGGGFGEAGSPMALLAKLFGGGFG